jgi:phosphate:Na+ symporter
VGLVEAGILTFAQSLGVIFGANVGSTVLSQLVAFNLTTIAPFIVVSGFILSFLKGKWATYSKPVFYFGLMFLSLSLIASLAAPLATDASIVALFAKLSNVFVAIAAGAAVTVFVQSSGVVSGVAVVLVATGILTFEQALGIIFGANIGTTVAALAASIGMHAAARKAALAHFLFNIIGVIVILPFIRPFGELVRSLGGDPGQQVANAHIIFNAASVLVFLVFIKPFEKTISILVKEHPEAHKPAEL